VNASSLHDQCLKVAYTAFIIRYNNGQDIRAALEIAVRRVLGQVEAHLTSDAAVERALHELRAIGETPEDNMLAALRAALDGDRG
jgi:hypothetical protein